MDQAVEVTSGLLDGLAHVVFTVEVEDIGNQVEGMLVVVDFGVEASKVEAVSEVLFVDFAEVFVATGGDELDREKKLADGLRRQNQKQCTQSSQ